MMPILYQPRQPKISVACYLYSSQIAVRILKTSGLFCLLPLCLLDCTGITVASLNKRFMTKNTRGIKIVYCFSSLSRLLACYPCMRYVLNLSPIPLNPLTDPSSLVKWQFQLGSGGRGNGVISFRQGVHAWWLQTTRHTWMLRRRKCFVRAK